MARGGGVHTIAQGRRRLCRRAAPTGTCARRPRRGFGRPLGRALGRAVGRAVVGRRWGPRRIRLGRGQRPARPIRHGPRGHAWTCRPSPVATRRQAVRIHPPNPTHSRHSARYDAQHWTRHSSRHRPRAPLSAPPLKAPQRSHRMVAVAVAGTTPSYLAQFRRLFALCPQDSALPGGRAPKSPPRKQNVAKTWNGAGRPSRSGDGTPARRWYRRIRTNSTARCRCRAFAPCGAPDRSMSRPTDCRD
jgi:hypothetical protein